MIYTLLFIAGIGIAAWGLVMLQRTFSFMKSGQRTTATVIEVVSYRDSEGSTMYKPVFEYTTFANQKETYRPNVGTSPSAWDVGDTAGLLYDANEPGKVMLVTYFGLFGWTVILLSIAMPLLIIGGGYFLAARYF